MSNLEIPIIFENKQILVLDKPAGIVTIPGPGHRFEDAVAGWVRSYVGEGILEVGEENRWGIVHRLDKDTSGVLVVAKTPEAYQHLKEHFRTRKVKKVYWALVWGEPRDSEFIINVPLMRHPKNWARVVIANKVANNNKAKEARTKFKVLQRGIKLPISPGRTRLPETFSLLECRPITGRTHQIRVHLKHAGFPIAGDLYYSGRRKYRAVKSFLGRPFLHAKSITLELPDGTQGEFEAEVPEELGNLLSGTASTDFLSRINTDS